MIEGANESDIVAQLQTQITNISSVLSEAVASVTLGEDSSTAGNDDRPQDLAGRILREVDECEKTILSLPSIEEIDKVKTQYLSASPRTPHLSHDSKEWEEWETTMMRLYKVHAALSDAVLGIRNDYCAGNEPSADVRGD